MEATKAIEVQDVRIRDVPVELVRRLKSVLAARGETLGEWFLMAAARDAAPANPKARAS
jgi:hypothetical protein